MFMAGALVGNCILGRISDKIGRRKGLLMALGLLVGGGIMSAVSQFYSTFIWARFIMGAGIVSVYVISFVNGKYS